MLEWQADRQRIDLLRLMGLRFRVPVPDDLVHRINQLTLPDQLAPWFDAVVTTDSLDAFREAVGVPPPGTNGAA